MPRDTWTPEREQELRALWRRGLSVSAIAARLSLSRGAVAAKAKRLRDAGDEALDSRKGRRSPSTTRIGPELTDMPPLPPPPVSVPPKLLLDLSRHECRWPLDDGQLFCAAPTAPGKSYCPHHESIARHGAPRSKRQSWTAADEARLVELRVGLGMTLQAVARELGRSQAAVASRIALMRRQGRWPSTGGRSDGGGGSSS